MNNVVSCLSTYFPRTQKLPVGGKSFEKRCDGALVYLLVLLSTYNSYPKEKKKFALSSFIAELQPQHFILLAKNLRLRF
jgi:hypothetical protein